MTRLLLTAGRVTEERAARILRWLTAEGERGRLGALPTLLLGTPAAAERPLQPQWVRIPGNQRVDMIGGP